jgi:hypothetical protein
MKKEYNRELGRNAQHILQQARMLEYMLGKEELASFTSK